MNGAWAAGDGYTDGYCWLMMVNLADGLMMGLMIVDVQSGLLTANDGD